MCKEHATGHKREATSEFWKKGSRKIGYKWQVLKCRRVERGKKADREWRTIGDT